MKVLSLVHHEVAGSGVFADEISLRGHELEEWMPAAGPIPRPLTDYGAVIAFGGGMQTDQEDRYPWLRVAIDALAETLTLGVPTLGVCLGAQVLARAAGGHVGPAPQAEWGWNAVELTDPATEDPLFSGLPRNDRRVPVALIRVRTAAARRGAGAQPRLPAELPDWQHCVGCAMASRGDGRIGASVGSRAPTGARWSAGFSRPGAAPSGGQVADRVYE